MTSPRSRRAALVTVALAVLGGSAGMARQAVPPQPTPPVRLDLVAGQSRVTTTDFDIVRIAVTDPAVADATVVQPREVLVDGKTIGTISLIIWGETQRSELQVVVAPGIPPLQRQLQSLFPGEDIRVTVSDEAVVLSGKVSSNEIAMRAAEIAQATSAKVRVVNMLRPPGDGTSQQVMLQVRFAEVDRRALVELGAALIGHTTKVETRTTTEQYPAPIFDDSKPAPIVFTDYLNLFFFWRPEGIGGAIKALQTKGYYHSLAEPNLLAYSGQPASFLAGGEFPVPVVQGNTGSVTIQYKEYGVRLTFTPVVAGDLVRLKVKPEVSAIDFNNGITLNGFRVPALTTRRAETEVELRDGQSFAIAGLLNNTAQETAGKVPILGDIPILGPLFKSRSTQKDQSELLVLITPRLVHPIDGIAPALAPPIVPVDPSLFFQPADPRKGRGGSPGQGGDGRGPGGKDR